MIFYNDWVSVVLIFAVTKNQENEILSFNGNYWFGIIQL